MFDLTSKLLVRILCIFYYAFAKDIKVNLFFLKILYTHSIIVI